jgi:hypothetical protein
VCGERLVRGGQSVVCLFEGGGRDPTTPAMAAGVADHVWTLEEIAGLLD